MTETLFCAAFLLLAVGLIQIARKERKLRRREKEAFARLVRVSASLRQKAIEFERLLGQFDKSNNYP